MPHDMTFVAPEHRAEVRRRIAVLEGFIASPGRAAAEQAASQLGLRPAQLYNLVRAWREGGRPESIMGRSAPRSTPPRIDPRVIELVDGIVAEEARSPIDTIVRRVIAAAVAIGLPPPDSSTVARHVRRRRAALLPTDIRDGFALLVDHSVIDLPVRFAGTVVMRPLITLAIDTAADAVVGLALSEGTPGPAATSRALADALRAGTRNAGGDASRIGIVASSPDEAAPVTDALRRNGLEASPILTHAHGGGFAVDSLLGQEHAGLRFRQRLVWNRGPRRRVGRPDATSLALEEAETMLRGRIAARRPTNAFASLDDIRRKRLADDLYTLVHPR